MVDKKYVVLRSRAAVVPAAENLGLEGLGPEPSTLEIDEAELSLAERNDLRRDPRTRAVAESMPMKLIAPTESEPVTAMADSVTWGVKAVGADESSFSGDGITVAVLDTGIDPNHPAFGGVTLARRNFTDEGDDDLNGHGTHCAGTIFGREVDGLRIGVAPGIRRALIGKVLGAGGGSSASIARAIQWAVNEGAHVVSMSLGIDFPGFVQRLVEERNMRIEPATSLALEAYRANINLFSELASFVRAQGAFNQGSVIIAASGNESDRPDFEIAVAPPAAGTGVIAVGALGEAAGGLRVADFSNSQVNVSGPGVRIVSAKAGGGLRIMSGTSMATPHIAGVASLWAHKLLAENGRVDSETLTAKLIASGQMGPLLAGSEEEDVGTGICQAPRN